MRHYLRFVVYFFALCHQADCHAQENLGLLHDNYTPIFSMRSNAASIADQKPWMSLQLAGAEVFLRNNAFFLEDSKIQHINEETVYNLNPNRRNYNAYAALRLDGPALSFTYTKHALGIHSAVRAYSDVGKIPGDWSQYIDSIQHIEIESGMYSINNLRVNGLSWAEIGLTYGQIYKQVNNNQFAWGFNLNRLIGIGAAGMHVNNAELEKRDTLDYGLVSQASANYYLAEPAYNSGKGWSLGLGFEYRKMKSDVSNHIPHSTKGGCAIPDYKFSVGVSLIDFGSLKFQENARQATFNANFNTEDLELILDGDLSDQIILNEENTFSVATPAALSIQLDYALSNAFYVSGVLFQNTGFVQRRGPNRANLFSAAIRYESRWFGAGLPISLYNYSVPQIGLKLRMGPIIIGTDHLSPFLVNASIYAASAYVSVHVPILRNPSCVEKGKKQRKTKNKEGFPPCPKW